MKLLKPTFVYFLFCGTMMFCRALHFTVGAVYYATVVGLNPFELVLVGTTLMVVILLGEVPTGVVADVYSRRLSVIIGTALIGVGFALEGAIPTFAAVLAAQLLWGIGLTFTSGALEAWIADELAGRDINNVYLRGGQVAQAGALAGVAGSVALASISLNLPLLVSGIALIAFAGLLLMIMGEHGFTPVPREQRSSWQLALHTVRDGVALVRGRHILLTIMGVTVFFGMASETFDRLWEVHFLGHFTFPSLGRLEPIVWFGIINGVARLLSIGVSEIVRRRFDTASHQGVVRLLSALTMLLIVSVVVFGVAGSFGLALLAFWSASMLRQVIGPIYTAWLNQHAESRVRATINSLAGQVDAIGQIAGGPPFGLLATAASTRVAMVASALVLLPVLALFRRSARRAGEDALEVVAGLPEAGD